MGSAENTAKYRLRHPEKIQEYKEWRRDSGAEAIYRKKYRYSTIRGWAQTVIDRLRNPSNQWKFFINIQDVIEQYRKQKGRCALTGMKMTLSAPAWSPTRPSLDRIDNKRGYHKDNIRLVWTWVNIARGAWSDEQLIKICRVIARKKEI